MHQNVTFIFFLYISKYHIYCTPLCIKLSIYFGSLCIKWHINFGSSLHQKITYFLPLYRKMSHLFHYSVHQNIKFVQFSMHQYVCFFLFCSLIHQNITFIALLCASKYPIYFTSLCMKLSHVFCSSLHQNITFILFLYASEYHIYLVLLYIKMSHLFLSSMHPNITFIFFLYAFKYDLLALLAKGQKSLCHGLVPVHPSMHPSMCPSIKFSEYHIYFIFYSTKCHILIYSSIHQKFTFTGLLNASKYYICFAPFHSKISHLFRSSVHQNVIIFL